jgi:hypothetical protein
MFTIAYDIRNLLIEIVTRRGERWKEISRACTQCKATYGKSEKSVLQWQFHAHCATSTILAGLSSLWLFLVFCVSIAKPPPRTAIRLCRSNQRWHFGSGFPGVDHQIGLDRCIAALE